MPLRILLVDDHKIMMAGVKAILSEIQDFEVIWETASGIEAIALSKKHHPDMIVMDIGLPGINGIEATQVIQRNAPGSKIIILSAYADEDSVVSSIRAGAQGYVLKQAAGRDLIEAIRTVARGGSYLSPSVSESLLGRIRRKGQTLAPATSALEILAPRELQVFRLVAAGNTSKDIAAILNLSLETVRGYRKTMMKKLAVNNIAGVTRVAIAHQVGLPEESYENFKAQDG